MNKKLLTRVISLLLLCLPVTINATEVFITIDEDGNRIFSDTPSIKSRSHKIREISTIPAIKLPAATTATAIDKKDIEIEYKKLTIISPTNETHISRDKLGSFVVSAQSEPGLADNDEAVLLFDGKEISSGKQMNWQINSAFRGTHNLQVIIRQQASKQQKLSSPPVTVFVKR